MPSQQAHVAPPSMACAVAGRPYSSGSEARERLDIISCGDLDAGLLELRLGHLVMGELGEGRTDEEADCNISDEVLGMTRRMALL